MGSTARGSGAGDLSDIIVYQPGEITGIKGNETIPGALTAGDLSCRTSQAANGRISSRAQELVGPLPVVGGYTPCTYAAPVTGIYNVVMYGPAGAASAANGTIAGDVGLALPGDFDTTQGSSIAAWDITVRSSLVSTTDINGRVFTYAFTAFTGGNSLPVFMTVYAVTTDGYKYTIQTNGMDPNGWLMYGNQIGSLDPNGTPLYHDVRGTSGAIGGVVGNVTLALPQYPLFFKPADNSTLTAIGIPTAPIVPTISALTFNGSVSGNTSLLGAGGTFGFTSNVQAVYDIVISQNGVNFDPTLPANRVLRGVKVAGANTVVWDGKDNSGANFPVGGPYQVQASIHGGEYHFPFIDVENSTLGGPIVTLTNGACPPWNGGCKGAFYDDRGYKTSAGVPIGTVNGRLCAGAAGDGNSLPPAVDHSDPLLGFDTSSNQRAFGVNTGTDNTNVDCTSINAFGDAKGLDLWTYTPSNTGTTTALIIPQGISGHVFQDTNGNGTQNGGEPNLSGLTVAITGPNSASGVTDANGNYVINVPAGVGYTVTITGPAGDILTTSNNPQTGLTVTAGAIKATTPVGFQPPTVINGHVFLDNNGDGTENGTDAGISGLTVVLTPAGGGAPITVTTNGTGDYSTPATAGTTYSVQVTGPAGDVLTTANNPQTVIAVGGVTTSATKVGFQPPTVINGHVFLDNNGDGTENGTDAGISGLTVVLTPAGGGAPITVTTNGTGDYSTPATAGTTYSVQVTGPAGDVLTTANNPQTVIAVGGVTTSATKVGFQPPTVINGHVFLDNNGDGTENGTDAGISGLTVVLTPAGGGAPITVTTNGTGDYSTPATAGTTYSVQVTGPAGDVLTTANNPQTVIAVGGVTTSATKVGFQPPTVINGHVFLDNNGDGTENGTDAGISGLTVVLTPAGGGAPITVTTNGTGDYSTPATAGTTYSVQVTGPAGDVLTTANNPQTVIAVGGVTTSATKVGFQPPTVINGHVFLDNNGDGTENGTDAGISGLTVVLTPAGGGAPITVTTNGTGDYSTPATAGTTYSVQVTGPAGDVLTTANNPQTVIAVGGVTTSATKVGFQPPTVINGHVFLDNNGDGTENGTDAGISGLTVVLTPAGGGAPIAVTTNATGDYSTPATAGTTYSVQVTGPAGTTLTTANNPQNVIAVGGTSTAATKVGFQPPTTINGHVFLDNNGDGIENGTDAGISGLTVVLTPAGGGAPIAVTGWTTMLPVITARQRQRARPTASRSPGNPGTTLTTANNPQNVIAVGGTSTAATKVGFQPPTTINGHVFLDNNGDGIENGTDAGISGLTVVLTPAGGGAPIAVTTNATGDYSTPATAGTTYSVQVTGPAGTTLTTANNPQNVIAVGGTSTAATKVGFQPPTTINGHVFLDNNGDGIENGTDAGISGLTVVLTPAGGGAPITVTTNGTGDYSTPATAGKTYSVQVTGPAGTTLTTANNPQTVIAIGGTTTAATKVGFQAPTVINGHVFLDNNGDGIENGTDAGISGLTVVLTPAGGGAPITVTTNGTGDYSTPATAGKTYSVQVTGPAGTTLTTANNPQTVIAIGRHPTAATKVGFQAPTVINGHVFLDNNGDGIENGTDAGISGLTVVLTPAGGGAPITVTTNGTGDYSTPATAGKTYSVQVTGPAGTTLTTANNPQTVIAIGGTTTAATKVGFQAPTVINGHVFLDNNGDGIENGTDAGISGLTVVLTPAGGGAPITVTTNGTGDYSTPATAGKTYSVQVTGPAGTTLTTANNPQTVIAVGGVTTAATKVGFQAPTVINGHVFLDNNGDGIENGTDAGISGLTVVLTPAGGGAPITVTTNGTGDYSTPATAGKTYSVQVTGPAGTTLTTANNPQTVIAVGGVTTAATKVGFQAPTVINGHVFLDNNGDGIENGTDAGISGLTVVLTPAGGGAPITVTTNGTGDYSTPATAGKTYSVQVTGPAGTTLTTANNPQTVIAVGGVTTSATKVGFQPPVGTGTVTGHVFQDNNGNKTQDVGEPNLSSLTVTFTPSGGGTPISTTTDVNGNYMVNVPGGVIYSVLVTGPAGNTLTTGNNPQTITVTTGKIMPTTPVGFQPSVTAVPGTPLLGVADPAIVKLVDPSLALPGENVTFSIVVTNNGTAAANSVVVTDPLPANLVVVSANTPQGTYVVSGNTVTFTIGTVTVGQHLTLIIVAKLDPRVAPPTTILNMAYLDYSGGMRRIGTASLRVTTGNLPATGEHPADTLNNVPNSISDGLVLMLTIGLVSSIILYRRMRLARVRG